MSVESFDDFNSTEEIDRLNNEKPFALRDKPSDKEETLRWLNQNFDACQSAAQSRFITYRRHHALYKGIHWRFQDTRDSNRDNPDYNSRNPRRTVNLVKEAVDTRVSQMARFKTSVSLIPAHNEQSDISNAKGCKLLLDARNEELEMETLQQEADAIKYQFGAVFQMVTWNKDIGPLHPSYRKLQERFGDDIPSKYKKKLKNEGTSSIHIGDVDVVNYGPDVIFPELNKKKWKDVNHFDLVEWVNIHELRADYPNKADEILENKRDYLNFDTLTISRPATMALVRHFYHKKTKYLPNGAYIKYTDDVILEWTDFPYRDGRLPFVVDGDNWVYDEIWPRSFISEIEGLQKDYNNGHSSQVRDIGVGGAPKWVAPKNACEIHQYNNDFTIMEFRGAIAPKLVQNNPISEQSFTLLDRWEKKISQLSKIYDITRGEVPQGVTANSALRFLDEQESQRTMPDEVKRKLRILACYRMMLNRMAQFYKEHDERTVRTLSKNNEYMIKAIKKADFNKVYDIRMQNSSSLPDTKTGRISTIVDLNTATQTDPVFRREEIVKMLDLGLDDAFKDQATVSLDAAMETLELLLDGEPAPEPQPWDNLLVHYSVFFKAIQSVAFKMRTEPAVIQTILEYVTTLEMLMFDKASKNQKFLMELMQVDTYPSLYELPAPLSTLMPMPPETSGSSGADTTKVENLTKEEKM